METEEKIYDVVVIGSGPAGMTAALYASRSNLSTLILERGLPGGQMNNTAEIENYPGFNSILGPELSEKMFEGSKQFGTEYAYADVQEIQQGIEYKTIIAGKKTFKTRSIVIATGAEYRKLGVSGENEYNGRGVSYCAVCDGAFFRNKELVVIGGGDSAVQEGTYLTQFAKKVTIVHRRDELRAQKILQDRAFKNEKIDFIWDSIVESIYGDDNKVTGVKIRNVHTNEEQEFAADGAFVYVGILPNTDKFRDLGITDEEGWIPTNETMESLQTGIFAVGDVRLTPLRQVATAVGDGSLAGNAVFHYVEKLKESLEEKVINQK
ncbi:thioredoxin-disulfide reductase [Carnobacterium sp. ISL-102]|uniref:thioredoxin-disulfide reductase n=1 Tax=Carnobacterium sp. ISL-102 TaxID=2819142 RepID=UPI001BECD593|nr:thioredoxin-disulfide reductase [Carnobacterium sp. ISL-102]MBT2733130.1 thioredoxin-disulfide reductase [Carnobacterium sp. ISL-102]